MTLKLVMDRLCPSGTSRLAQVVLVPVGQAQPVQVVQAYWNRLCLSHWHKQAGCTKPVPLGLGEVKRDLSLCHVTSHIPTMKAFPCAMAQALYHDGACTCSTCANLWHKVGLQGREKSYTFANTRPINPIVNLGFDRDQNSGTPDKWYMLILLRRQFGIVIRLPKFSTSFHRSRGYRDSLLETVPEAVPIAANRSQ